VTAFREALKEQTPERVPLDWAATQNNLGVALLGLGVALVGLGEREDGTSRLEEAVAAFREALKKRTPDWAETTGNQGVALMALAQGRGDAGVANTAVQQLTIAFQTMRDGGNTPLATYYEARLAEARTLVDRLGTRPAEDKGQ
jgi:hypothetical protein